MASGPVREAVGIGEAVGVGCGMSSTCPSEIKQLEDRLFSVTMVWMETLKSAAIPEQTSPARTVYSNGGRGVQVEAGVGVVVSVGVNVMVGVSVIVGILVGSTTQPVD